MADLGELKVRLSAQTAQFNKQVDAALKTASMSLKSFSDNMAALSKGAAVLGTGLTAAIGKATKSFADAEETMNLVQVTFGSMANDTLKWADKFAKATNLSSTEIAGLAGGMQSMLGPMIGNTEQAAKMSMQLTEAAVDLGSLFNTDKEDALARLRSAMSGSTEAVEKFGINLKVSAMDAFALQKGLGKTTKQMSEQEKMMLRYQMILDGASQAQGDATKTSGSLTNMMRGLGAAIKDFEITIGQTFGPFVRESLAKAIAGVRSLTDGIKGLSKETKEKLAKGFMDAAKALAILTAGAAATSGLAKLASGISDVANKLWDMKVPLLTAAIGITALVLIVGSLKIAWDNFGESIKSSLSEVGSTTGNVISTVKEMFADLIAITDKFFGMLSSGFGNVMSLIQGDISLSQFWKRMKAEVTDYTDTANARVAEVQDDFGDQTKKITEPLKEIGKGIETYVADPLEESAKAGVAAFKGMFSELGGMLKNFAMDASGELGQVFANAANAATTASASRKKSTTTLARPTIPGSATLDKGTNVGPAVTGSTALNLDANRTNLAIFKSQQRAMQLTTDALVSLGGEAGEAGTLISSAAQGFAQGGPVGGVLAAFAALVTQTETFQFLVERLNPIVSVMVKALDDLLAPVWNMVGPLTDVIAIVVQLSAIMARFMFFTELLTDAMWVLSKGINFIGNQFYKMIHGLIRAVNWVLGKLRMGKIKQPKNPFDELLESEPEVKTFVKTIEDSSNKLKKFNTEITNAPSGLKLAFTRFKAANRDTMEDLTKTPLKKQLETEFEGLRQEERDQANEQGEIDRLRRDVMATDKEFEALMPDAPMLPATQIGGGRELATGNVSDSPIAAGDREFAALGGVAAPAPIVVENMQVVADNAKALQEELEREQAQINKRQTGRAGRNMSAAWYDRQ